MDALSTIETMKAEVETLMGGIEARGFATFNGDGEAKIEAPKPPMFKCSCDALKVENFLWHLSSS